MGELFNSGSVRGRFERSDGLIYLNNREEYGWKVET